MKAALAVLLCVGVALLTLAWLGDGALVRITPTPAAPARTTAPAVVAPPGRGDVPDMATGAERTHAYPPPGGAAKALPITPPVQPPAASSATPAATAALLIPVQGVQADQLQDTFTDARSEGRAHDAIDIMAPAGTPVLAVADGTVAKRFNSERGGLTLYQFDSTGRLAYYYAHLQDYADGLEEGQPLRRGQRIGHVGSTGNASPDAPHLHFAIFVLGPERRWWEGTAVNPYPVLRGTAALP